MSSLRKALLAGAGGTIISMGLTGAALASAVTLNPGANNAPAGAALCATCADFTATAATIEQHSLIVFSGTGAGTTFSETGNFIIDGFTGSSANGNGLNSASGYQLFGTFTSSGTGTLTLGAGGGFTGTALTGFTVTLLGQTGNTVTGNTPTTLAGNGLSGITTGYQLGTGTVAPFIGTVASLVFDSLTGTGVNLATLKAGVQFIPANGTQGNFFEAPLNLNLQITVNAHEPSNAPGDTLVFKCDANGAADPTSGADTCVTLGDSTEPGSGTLALNASVVPEPTTLALFGVGLFGFGMVARRRRSV
jgi:hypothetical protein